jgi:ubiquinone/menaquinone biosynthesis C-methylase UbiE
MSESLNFDPIAHRYDDTRGYSAEVADAIAAGLLKMGDVPPGGNLLEIGIGTGRIALPLLTRGVNVTGVDISTRMVERLRAKYDAERDADPGRRIGTLRVEMVDMTALPFADGAFNAVVAVHVLHLVPQWRRALDEALRVVKPGGVLLLGQDTHLSEDAQWHVQTHWLNTVRELGGLTPRVGAAGFDAVLDELKRRGLPVEVLELTRWTTTRTPREGLQHITNREWSRTWNVPDDIFAESVRRLTAWAEQEYAGMMDTPRNLPTAFKVARVVKA